MASEQKNKNVNKDAVEEEEVSPNTETNVDTDEVDDFLDEIDDVLEENAEEFILSYVQRGGQ